MKRNEDILQTTTMSFVCKICDEFPYSHSFSKVGEENNVPVYYTCPAKAIKYNDSVGIMKHYKDTLDSLQGSPWKWVFDSKGFGWKHATQIGLAIELAKLISSKTYGDTLQDITLLNLNSYGKCMLNLLWNFLSTDIQTKIKLSAQS